MKILRELREHALKTTREIMGRYLNYDGPSEDEVAVALYEATLQERLDVITTMSPMDVTPLLERAARDAHQALLEIRKARAEGREFHMTADLLCITADCPNAPAPEFSGLNHQRLPPIGPPSILDPWQAERFIDKLVRPWPSIFRMPDHMLLHSSPHLPSGNLADQDRESQEAVETVRGTGTEPRLCDDGGTCHHECEEGACLRRRTLCAPLSSTGCDTWEQVDALISAGNAPFYPNLLRVKEDD